MGCGASIKKVEAASECQEETRGEEESETDIPCLTVRSVNESSEIPDISSSEGTLAEQCIDHLEGYEFVQKLGKGASSVVLQMEKESRQYAVKICDLTMNQHIFASSSSSHDPKEEAALLLKFDHPNVVKVYDFLDDDCSHIYIVMELLNGGDITSCATMASKREAILQVVSGLKYIHFQRIAHRDIKTDNILRDSDGKAKIIDFGISQFIPEGQNKVKLSMKGTPAYQAPETFGETPYDPFKSDIWSLGVTLYIMLFHKLPFQTDKINDIGRIINHDKPRFDEKADPRVVDLINRMLEKDPEKRITLEQIEMHPWFKGTRARFDYNIDSNVPIYKTITTEDKKNSIQKIGTWNTGRGTDSSSAIISAL